MRSILICLFILTLASGAGAQVVLEGVIKRHFTGRDVLPDPGATAYVVPYTSDWKGSYDTLVSYAGMQMKQLMYKRNVNKYGKRKAKSMDGGVGDMDDLKVQEMYGAYVYAAGKAFTRVRESPKRKTAIADSAGAYRIVLPASGKYLILINSKGNTVDYTLNTYSIKMWEAGKNGRKKLSPILELL